MLPGLVVLLLPAIWIRLFYAGIQNRIIECDQLKNIGDADLKTIRIYLLLKSELVT